MIATHELQHFPLERAFYCSDCKSVGNSGNWCPACGCAGSNLLPLWKVLNPAVDPKVVAEVRE
jgi:hypothetical protein